jgi:uncharacterized YigZ family protein
VEKIRTLGKASESVYKEKGSKFMAFAYPVRSEDEVKEKIEFLKKQYYDARHHCFAYILAGPPEYFRAYDDREPKHSAGNPMLGQLRSHQLQDVLVVVVRYFGGTKLGVSGLINAYKTATAEAILNNTIVEHEITKPIRIQFDYKATNEVMQLLQVHNLEIIRQDFKEKCTFTLLINLDKYEEVSHQFKLLPQIEIL